MMRLDERTIERLAEVICDLGGPFERRGHQLQRLLEHSGWGTSVEYDGTARVPWLRETLLGRRHDEAAIERLLCRVCDPLEYGDAPTAELMRGAINRVLEPEGVAVLLAGRRPVLGTLGDAQHTKGFTLPDDLEGRLDRLITDKQTVGLLLARAGEADSCVRSGAHTLAIIGLGSFVEGVLYAVIAERAPEATDAGLRLKGGNSLPWHRVGLNILIDEVHDRGWIKVDAHDFVQTVRDYRNMVHPRQQLEKGLIPDEDTVMLCWGPVRAVLNDLATTFA